MRNVRLFLLLSAFLLSMHVTAQIDSLVPGNTCWGKPTVWGNNYAGYTMYRPMDYYVDGYANSYMASSRSIGTSSSGIAQYEYEVTKFDSTGAIVWTIRPNALLNLTLINDFRTAYVTGIAADANKNVYITGFFASKKMIFDSLVFNYNTSANRGFVAKLDSNGTYRWVTIQDGAGNYRSGTSIICSGNLLYIGMYGGGTVYTPDGNSTTIGNMTVLVMDVFGSYVTNYSFGNGGTIVSVAAEMTTTTSQTCHYIPLCPMIKRTPSGKIVVAGRTSDYVLLGTTYYYCPYPSFCNTYCMVLDTATGFQPPFFISYRNNFYESYELQRIEKRPVFTVDASDNIYYTDHWEENYIQQVGDYENVFLPDGTVLSADTSRGSCIIKYNLAGQYQWSTTHSDITFSSIENTASGIYFYGSYRGGLLIRSQNGDSFAYGQNNGIQDLFVAKSDANGNFQYVSPFGGNDIDIAYFIRKSPCSENFYITGLQSQFLITFNQQQTIQQAQGNRVFVLKHSPASTCFDPVCVIPSGVDEPAVQDERLLLYPVPADGYIFADKLEQGRYAIRITDVNGRQVVSENTYISGKHQLGLAGLPAGLYFIYVTGENHHYTGRFIVASAD